MSFVAMLAAAVLQTTAAAEPAGPAASQEPPPTLGEVTVTAPTPDVVDEFIEELALPDRLGRVEGQMARWSAPLCPVAIGAEPAVNAYVAARIIEAGDAAGVLRAKGRCRPNVVVVLTDDADGFIDVFSERYRRRFFSTGSRSELAAFRAPARPVRWWHVTRTGCAHDAPSAAELSVGRLRNADECDLIPSRLVTSAQANITRTLVVVDTKRLQGLHSRSVTAYITFAVFAHLPQQPEVGGLNSILGVFEARDSGRRPPKDLTRWDLAYLKSLYTMRSDQRFPLQRADLKRRMQRELQGPVEDAPAAGRAEP